MYENEIDLVRATSSYEEYVCNMAMVDTYMCYVSSNGTCNRQ